MRLRKGDRIPPNGRLAVAQDATATTRTKVAMSCDCGQTKEILLASLLSGKTTSCGCAHKAAVTKHGQHRTITYRTWKSMISRCYDASHHAYHRYGGRGISVCESWKTSFSTFLNDMGERPSTLHSIDRFPDKNGNYEQSNCRWATKKEQNNNTRSNVLVTCDGRTMTATEWARQVGLPPHVVLDRLSRGWLIHDALNTPVRKGVPHGSRTITLGNTTLSVSQWSASTGLPVGTINYRLRQGWGAQRALDPSKRPHS